MYAFPRFLYLPLERNIKHMDMPHFTFSLPIAKCHGLAARPPTLPPTLLLPGLNAIILENYVRFPSSCNVV